MYLARLIVFPALSADKLLFPIGQSLSITYNFGKSDPKPFSIVSKLWEVQPK